MDELKLCPDCKWYRDVVDGGHRLHVCMIRVSKTPSIHDARVDLCINRRANESECGVDAKWFKPKDNFQQEVK